MNESENELHSAESREVENAISTAPKKKRRVWLIVLLSLLGVIAVLCIAAAAYVWHTYSAMQEDVPFIENTEVYSCPAEPEGITPAEEYSEDDDGELDYDNIVGSDYLEPDGTATPIYEIAQKNPDIINVLLLGRDSRDPAHDRGRSDTMMVVSYNKATKQVKMISIMRDCLVPVEGYGWTKLNHAYAYGGVGLTINTINQLFDLDIQNYIAVDFSGVQEILNKVDGVDVYLTSAEVEHYIYTGLAKPGEFAPDAVNHLNGYQARIHMQNRWVNGDGDFSRTRRQRDVMNALLTKMTSSEMSIGQMTDLVSYCTTKTGTNIPFTTVISLGTDVLTSASDITAEQSSLPFAGMWQYAQYNGMSVLKIDIDACAAEINRIIYGEN